MSNFDQFTRCPPVFGMTGFLGSRGSFMLDLVFVAMFAVLPVMALSIYLVKFKRKYKVHKQIQLLIGLILLFAVGAFEIDMRLNGWRHLAEDSVFSKPGDWNDWIEYSLIVHLFFAIPTAGLWGYVIVQAIRRFPNPPIPNEYSNSHIFWARLAAVEMTMTAITGWVFYWLAFVA